MKKRSTFESVLPFIGFFAALVSCFAIWRVFMHLMWIWNPNGLIDNLNPGTDTVCRAMGLINCTMESERTFWNYKTDEIGEFYAEVQALCLLGCVIIILGCLIWISNRALKSLKQKEKLIFASLYEALEIQPSNGEPHVADDPQHRINDRKGP